MFHCNCRLSFEKIPIPPHNIIQALKARGVLFGDYCFTHPLVGIHFPSDWSYINIDDHWYIFDAQKQLIVWYLANSQGYAFSTKKDNLPFTYPIPEFYTVVYHELQINPATDVGKFLDLLQDCSNEYHKYLQGRYSTNLLGPTPLLKLRILPAKALVRYFNIITEYKTFIPYHYKEFTSYKRFLQKELPPITLEEIDTYCTSKRRKKQYRNFFCDGRIKTEDELYRDQIHKELSLLDKDDPHYAMRFNKLVKDHELDYELLPMPEFEGKCIVM
jgi:hypothetical protein